MEVLKEERSRPPREEVAMPEMSVLAGSQGYVYAQSPARAKLPACLVTSKCPHRDYPHDRICSDKVYSERS